MTSAAGGTPAPVLEARYSRKAKLRDLGIAVLGGGIPGVTASILISRYVEEDPTVWSVLGAWVFCAIPVLFVLGLWRWRSWARLDGEVVAAGKDPRSGAESLAWVDVEEVVWIGRGGVELRGGGRQVRLDGDLGNDPDVRKEAVSRVWNPLLEKMKRTLGEEGGLRIGGGMDAPEAARHVLLPGALLGVWPVSFLFQAAFLAGHPRAESPAVISGVVMAGVALLLLAVLMRSLWKSWAWARRGGRVSAAGLDIPGRRDRIAWEEVLPPEGAGSRYIYPLRKGGRLRIPSDLPNAMILDRVIRDRLKR